VIALKTDATGERISGIAERTSVIYAGTAEITVGARMALGLTGLVRAAAGQMASVPEEGRIALVLEGSRGIRDPDIAALVGLRGA